MKTLRMMGSERVELIELPEPDPVDGFVVAKIMASAICGSGRRAASLYPVCCRQKREDRPVPVEVMRAPTGREQP